MMVYKLVVSLQCWNAVRSNSQGRDFPHKKSGDPPVSFRKHPTGQNCYSYSFVKPLTSGFKTDHNRIEQIINRCKQDEGSLEPYCSDKRIRQP